jgi:transcription antitermination factor NusG
MSAANHPIRPSNPFALPATLLGMPRQWYAVYCRVNHEKRVADQLHGKALESFLPTYESVHRWKDRKVVITSPLFPGYLFVHLSSSDRMQVLTVPGVVSLVGPAGCPIPVAEQEIQSLKRWVDRKLKMQPFPHFVVGNRVRIKGGPLADVEGVLVRTANNFRLVLSVSLINQSVCVEVDGADVAVA